MRVIVITPPDPVVTYAEAAARLKLGSGAGQQADVEKMIAAATALFDPPLGWLGRAIGEQTLELRCPSFYGARGKALKLPYPPIATIVSVKYLDAAGAEQTLAPSDYELIGDDLWPGLNATFPATRSHPEAVRVRYSAGYDDVPANITGAILLAVGDMFRYRDTVAFTSVDKLPSSGSIDNLLETTRVFR